MTSCRLKLFHEDDTLYSNTFRMGISRSQFLKVTDRERQPAPG